MGKIGVGLGCWVDASLNGTWPVTAESAEQRISVLLDDSITEIGMFRIVPSRNFPEDFWIPQLQRYMAGVAQCPEGFTGPNAQGCCTAASTSDCKRDCARQRCEA